jgi:hypothetical protein
MIVSQVNVMRRRSQSLTPLLPEVGSLSVGRWNVRFQPPRQTFTNLLTHVLAKGNTLFPLMQVRTMMYLI